ncbi:transmembrane protein, putative (macronuclear) [Tetrahymena thermophila SB210]|uniref:Transmembrane protein, putative n=1 Tax=Tetrahymena thermophila (strain SB210) TaxID=312017 RepID=W7XG63_TETTS|nr:transmembrane protein, putative [Tetrahymena thermophila SB210]EWS73086.1 transmembrane protein, putative [Tetrahymena thermophila SB210]|eukprot:XP_012654395.1 transmembrane protein, putative [Tetrahymena thermophila SB210]
MEFNQTYFTIQGIFYTISIQTLNILNFSLLFEGHHLFFAYYVSLFIIEKLYMHKKLSQNRDEEIFLFFDILDLYFLLKKKSEQIWSNDIHFMIKLFIRFFFLPWVFYIYLLRSEYFSYQKPYLQYLIIISFIFIIIQSANVMYLSNTFKVHFLNMFEFLAFLSVLMQCLSLTGMMTLFIISYSNFEFWIVVAIKLAIIVVFCLAIYGDKFEFYNVSDNQTKTFLSTLLISFSFISDTSPFFSYGKIKKPDNYKDSKMSSQRTLVFMRIVQFIECLIYYALYDSQSPCFQQNSLLSQFSQVIVFAFWINTMITLYYFSICLYQYLTKNYEYIAQLSIDREIAEKIVINSKKFVLIEFNLVTNVTQTSEKFWYQLLDLSFTPNPQVGFRKINYGGLFTLNNSSVQLSKNIFLDIFCNFYSDQSQIPNRAISFKEPLNVIEQKKLKKALINRLFQYGYSQNMEEYFVLLCSDSKILINSFIYSIIKVDLFYKIIAPQCNFFPQQILFDLYDF